LFVGLRNRIGKAFGYDAAESTAARKAPAVRQVSEDTELNQAKRGKVNAVSIDLKRNFATVGWGIRKHLDYVSRFRFQARTGNSQLDDQLEKLVKIQSRAENCDAAGRHSLDKMLRLVEQMAILTGDCGLLKLRDGRLQGIEGERIRDTTGGSTSQDEPFQWIQGIRVNRAGKSVAYALHKRTGSSFGLERNVPAANMIWHGYYDRFDQVRGISPITSALNSFQDCYEASDYALQKMKVNQFFTMVMKLKDNNEAPGTEDDSEDAANPVVSFGKYGPRQLIMKEGDEVSTLESAQPSNQFQDYTRFTISVALKALDIPYSFFDESFTNFYGSRAAAIQYVRSCKDKVENLRGVLRKITDWWFQLWILDGHLVLPEGMTIDDLNYEWIQEGMPWWDPEKEINAAIMSVNAGFNSPQRVCRENGTGDFFEMIDETKEAFEYAAKNGVPLIYGMSTMPVTAQPPANQTNPDETANKELRAWYGKD